MRGKKYIDHDGYHGTGLVTLNYVLLMVGTAKNFTIADGGCYRYGREYDVRSIDLRKYRDWGCLILASILI